MIRLRSAMVHVVSFAVPAVARVRRQRDAAIAKLVELQERKPRNDAVAVGLDIAAELADIKARVAAVQSVLDHRQYEELSANPRMIRLATGLLGFFVPLHHTDVVRPRPPELRYEAVAKVIDRDMDVVDQLLEELAPYLRHEALAAISSMPTGDLEPYWNNGYYEGDDARLAFAIPAIKRPRTIIEIGSGNSTRFMRKAVQVFSLQTKLVSIDPEPRAEVMGIADEVIRKNLLDVPMSIFSRLEAGDILFHDGSHLVVNGTDTVRLFLEILPALSPGVIVHIHDICLPFEYISEFKDRGYGEQYLLASVLLYGARWQVIMPTFYVATQGKLREGGGSFWMKKLC